ncbi:MAG: bifunctional oligoribonuclease/PAP phosphatase NrnA [Gemmatimonadota bacterium]|nr:bifunctional oligoribonuclease/PAP phosphatase NrnA [Gemmatimonadota bacterium]
MTQQIEVPAGWTEELVRSVRAAGQGISSDRAAELADILAPRRGERHIVAIQDFPDPDAISSAMAYREIARRFGITADVVYDGQISHPQNLALVNLLDIELVRYTAQLQLAQYDAAVFVDNQGTTSHLTPLLRAAGVHSLAIIDHHDPQDVLDPIFSDIRPVGAAATLMTEYLRSGKLLALDREEASHVQLATALMHGLHSETDGFVHAGEAEHHAASYLSRFVDEELLERILCVQKSRASMRVIESALASRNVRSGLSVAGVGYIRWADRDAIPQAADFLLQEENVHSVVVFGILHGDTEREVVSGSLRTSKATMAVDTFLKNALGADLRGEYYGGGRTRAGGFEIEVGFLGGEDGEERDLKWKLFDQKIRAKLFRAVGAETEEEGGTGGSPGSLE